MAVKTYNARQVTISCGTHAITGVADDSFLTIEKLGDGVTSTTGCDGEVARAVDPNGCYSVKLSLLQTSASNAFLQAQHDNDKKTGDGVFPILIKDIKGGLLFSADSAWVKKSTTRTFGKGLNNREWELETGEADLTEGTY